MQRFPRAVALTSEQLKNMTVAYKDMPDDYKDMAEACDIKPTREAWEGELEYLGEVGTLALVDIP